MMKPGTPFVAACIATIGLSIAVVAVAGFGANIAVALVLGGGAAAALGTVHFLTLRAQAVEGADDPRVASMSRHVAAVVQRLDTIEQRMGRLERTQQEQLHRAVGPLAEEIAELGTLVRQLAEEVHAHELLLQAPAAAPVPEAPVMELPAEPVAPAIPQRQDAPRISRGWTSAPPQMPAEPQPQPVQRQPAERPVPNMRFTAPQPPPASARPAPRDAGRLDVAPSSPLHDPVEDYDEAPVARAEAEPARDPATLIPVLRRALERGAIELHLRPVVSLPQRRTTHYEVSCYMRDDQDDLLYPEEVDLAARAGRLLTARDALLVDRAVRVARRLKARERETTLLVEIAVDNMGSEAFASEVARRLDMSADLAAQLMLMVPQAALQRLGALEAEMLQSLAERGFRFGMNRVTNLSFDAKGLNEMGVRLIKVPTPLLFDEAVASRADVHPADLPDLFRRHGILMVADDVAMESNVVDLLDYDVRAAAGPLFGQPRPVRPDVFQAPEPTVSPAGSAARPERGGGAGQAVVREPSTTNPPQARGLRSIARRA